MASASQTRLRVLWWKTWCQSSPTARFTTASSADSWIVWYLCSKWAVPWIWWSFFFFFFNFVTNVTRQEFLVFIFWSFPFFFFFFWLPPGVYTMGHLSHSDPYIPFKTFPGTFLFFFLQPLGIILEPYIIPYIPTRFGSKLWTYSFLLLTCPLFANVLHRHGSWLSSFKPISDWGWLEILTPVYIFPHLIESFKHSIRILL